MNNKGNAFIWIGIILSVLFLILGISLGILSSQSKKMCSNECADKGTRFSKIIPNGEWFNTRDLCICYLPDKVESFVMSEDLKWIYMKKI